MIIKIVIKYDFVVATASNIILQSLFNLYRVVLQYGYYHLMIIRWKKIEEISAQDFCLKDKINKIVEFKAIGKPFFTLTWWNQVNGASCFSDRNSVRHSSFVILPRKKLIFVSRQGPDISTFCKSHFQEIQCQYFQIF